MKHWFWLLLSFGCVGWYLVITAYIAYRGIIDIRNMLSPRPEDEPPESQP